MRRVALGTLSDEQLPYRYRIEVIWDGAIYRADYYAVLEGIGKYNQRSWTSANRADYRLVVDRILDGEIVQRVRERPKLPWEDAT